MENYVYGNVKSVSDEAVVIRDEHDNEVQLSFRKLALSVAKDTFLSYIGRKIRFGFDEEKEINVVPILPD